MTQPVGSVYEVTNEVVWSSLSLRCLSLRTVMHMKPYTAFDNDSTKGTTRTLLYPQPLRASKGLVVTGTQSIQQKEQFITIKDPENYINLQLNQMWTDASFFQMANNPDQWWKKYGTGAMTAIGALENAIAVKALTDNFYDIYGDPNANLNGVNTMTDLSAIEVVMGFDELTPGETAVFGVTPIAYNALNNPTVGYFNQAFNSPVLNENLQMKNARNFSGQDVYSDAQIQKHTNGTWAAAGAITIVSVNAATVGDPNQYTEMVWGGFTPGATVNYDDRFDITQTGDALPMFKLLPGSFSESDYPQRFQVRTTSGPADSSGEITVTVNPGLIGPNTVGGQVPSMWQNIIYDPTTLVGATINLFGNPGATYAQNLFWLPAAGLYANPFIYQAPMKSRYMSAPYVAQEEHKIPGSDLMSRILITSDGDQLNALFEMVFRSAATATAFGGYGCVYASIK